MQNRIKKKIVFCVLLADDNLLQFWIILFIVTVDILWSKLLNGCFDDVVVSNWFHVLVVLFYLVFNFHLNVFLFHFVCTLHILIFLFIFIFINHLFILNHFFWFWFIINLIIINFLCTFLNLCCSFFRCRSWFRNILYFWWTLLNFSLSIINLRSHIKLLMLHLLFTLKNFTGEIFCWKLWGTFKLWFYCQTPLFAGRNLFLYPIKRNRSNRWPKLIIFWNWCYKSWALYSFWRTMWGKWN